MKQTNDINLGQDYHSGQRKQLVDDNQTLSLFVIIEFFPSVEMCDMEIN